MVQHRLTKAALLVVLPALIITGCYRTPEQRAEHMVKHIASELNLNDAQKAQLERIKDDFLARRPQMAREREETVKGANELMRSADIDKAKLDALVEKNKTQANDMISFIAAKFTEIHDMLTPEQREKLVVHIEKYLGQDREKRVAEKKSSPGGGY